MVNALHSSHGQGHCVAFFGEDTQLSQRLSTPRHINGYQHLLLGGNHPINQHPIQSKGRQKYPYSLHAVGPEIMPWPDGALDPDTDTIPACGRVQVHFNTRLPDNNSVSNHGSYFPPESSLPCTDVQKLTPRKSNDLSSYNRLMTSLQENTKTTAMYTQLSQTNNLLVVFSLVCPVLVVFIFGLSFVC